MPKFTVAIAKDGKGMIREYEALLGISFQGEELEVEIHETANMPDSFWIELPVRLASSLAEMLEARRKAILEMKG